MTFTDVHAHFLPEGYVDAAGAAPDGIPAWPSWSVREHLALADEIGVDRSMLSVSSPGIWFGDDGAARRLARSVNDQGAELARERPDRFGYFASLPLPDVDAALAELDRVLPGMADGVVLMTNVDGFYLGDARYAPLWAELDRRDAVVFLHPTSPPGADRLRLGRPAPMLEFPLDTTRTVLDLLFAGVLDRHPDLRVIVPHGGAALPLMAPRADEIGHILSGADTSITDGLGALWYDTAGTPLPAQLPALERAVGLDHVVYGSDYCFTPPAAVARQVASLDAAGLRGTLERNGAALVASR